MVAPAQATLEMLKVALDRLDEDGPIVCAAYVSHAVELLRQHMVDHPRPLAPLEKR